ncbi:L,D-transpeptidase [Legionella jamestowniensis]|uniref:Endopeptidase IV n=1 Tax=Legionella jamestowniensis TaxID=455 RepID=A0A0W0UTY8_9GAMM|nr:L,D-transpeptidase [Legionella jamestowniensis]KTD11343.1 enhanced entry protein EnhA [Legionella jamestowniensis]OCH98798.1 endopeptidase IV [Legionella jamestowniensis]SFL68777.1 L,D-transpeptidase catalytic domain [Legionella jamestowniensis DSM 19215]
MKSCILLLCFLPTLLLAKAEIHEANYYGPSLCKYKDYYTCIKVTRGKNWEKLFPDTVQRDLVQRLNRTNNRLWNGKVLAVPKNLATATLFNLSPFPLKINPSDNTQIIVDQEKLAWGAYDQHGYLVHWGPISSGSNKCSDSDDSCLTLTGIFEIFGKEDKHCISNAFPAGRGGARMPYCMFFHKGFALHGSDDIPGKRASHGCVRMFIQDAKWLNENFVTLYDPQKKTGGTVVIVLPLLKEN